MADTEREAVAAVAQVIHPLTCRAAALKAACDGPVPADFETARSVVAIVRTHLLATERERIREGAGALKFTLFRPGNGPAQGSSMDVVPLGELLALLDGPQ